MNYDYARLGNDDNSCNVFVAKVYEINECIFKTKTIMSGKVHVDYNYDYIKNHAEYRVHSREDVIYYNFCTPSEANYIILPTLHDNYFEKVVKTISDNMFIIREKVFIETHKEIEQGIKLPNGRDNEILGCIYLEHVPAVNTKYDADMNTIVKVYNERVKYIKEIIKFKPKEYGCS